MKTFTHLDEFGHPRMVDVGGKKVTLREARAEGVVLLPSTIRDALIAGTTEKGDVLKIAEIAGIMAVKKTSDLIPLCHNISLNKVDVHCELIAEESQVKITSVVAAKEVTGVEMEALTGVMVAALTVYDMCKGIDKGMIIHNIRLLRKSGGKSGDYHSPEGEHE